MSFFNKPKLNEHLLPDILPKHIAFIMDGNGRWASKKGLPRTVGHSKGAKNFEDVAEMCFTAGIKSVTSYAFSTENWKRPKTEVDAIMKILDEYLDTCLDRCLKKGIHLRFLGDRSAFPASTIKKMNNIEKTTEKLEYNLNVALNYGARSELCRAAMLSAKAAAKKGTSEITEDDISANLYTTDIGDPDIIVRTGGEMRLSNFLLWQAAYAEFYFTDTLWPDFGKIELYKILHKFAKTNRRYGGI